MKPLLIHGYATKLRASIFRAPLPDHAGFIAFQSAIKTGDADVFHWGIHRDLSFIESLNPFSYLKLYRDEEVLAHSPETQEKLFRYMEASQPEHIICHSMGCRLLLLTMNRFIVPSSVRSITFLQADIDSRPPSYALRPTNYVLHHYFCPWDPSLLASSILHGSVRLGMRAWKTNSVENHFYPLLKPVNLHTSQLRDNILATTLIKT